VSVDERTDATIPPYGLASYDEFEIHFSGENMLMEITWVPHGPD